MREKQVNEYLTKNFSKIITKKYEKAIKNHEDNFTSWKRELKYHCMNENDVALRILNEYAQELEFMNSLKGKSKKQYQKHMEHE